MRSLRQNLRQLAIAWLIVQAASLSALAGFDCCATHRKTKAEAEAARTADAPPCPMHAAAPSDKAPASKQQKCVMRGTCQGPMAALLVVLSNNGIPSESIETMPVLVVIAAAAISPDTFVAHSESPDTPPPRV